jgi:hypothetical protein
MYGSLSLGNISLNWEKEERGNVWQALAIFRNRIESRDSIIGEKPNGKNASSCIIVHRSNGYKNIPPSFKLLLTISISYGFKRYLEFFENMYWPPRVRLLKIP